MSSFSVIISDFRLAIDQLSHRGLRTLLTALGMIFGVGAVIAMLAVSEGGRQESMKMIEGMGIQNIIVDDIQFTNEELLEIRKHSAGLSRADAIAVAESVPSVEKWAGVREIKAWNLFSHEGNSRNTQVWAVNSDFFELSNLEPVVGEIFTQEDDEKFAPKAVLGDATARDLFPNGDAVGKPVKVNFTWFEVVGILQDRAIEGDTFQGEAVGGESARVYIPLNSGLNRLRNADMASELSKVKFRITAGQDLAAASNAIRDGILSRHGSQEDIHVVNPTKLLAQERSQQRIFTIVMSSVAGISLLVGGIGIMNIKLASVLERKSEIGLMRAVGATQSDVVRQFLIETIVIAVFGALIGILAGTGMAYLIASFAEWAVAWNVIGMVVAVVFCVAIAVGFGVYPAMSASKLDPVLALQAE